MPTTKGPVAPLAACLLAACLLFALTGASGCSRPAATARETPASGASEATSGAAKTRELEEKAAGYKERFQEIQESDMTAEEKAQAAGELVDEQQRTVREAEEGAGGGDEAEQ
jgi:hypothetical protein